MNPSGIESHRCKTRGLRLAVACGLLALSMTAPAAEVMRKVQPPTVDEVLSPESSTETAVFAGGCFWGVQGVFQHVKGVQRAVSGYAGGEEKTASYDRVSSGTTGHAEAVEVSFDPRQVSYGQLLRIFFSVVHDPTQLDHQGADVGTQYRSAVFPRNEAQQRVVDLYIKQLSTAGAFPDKIVTRTDPLHAFYPAEAYHQDFLSRHPSHPYIAFNDIPKVEGLKRMFPEWYRDQPVLVSHPQSPR